MIDWFKIELMNRPAAALKQKLDYTTSLNIKTGVEVGNYEESLMKLHDDKGCAVSVKLYPSGRVTVQGSIHKFWNGNNYSVLTYCEMQKAFNFIFEKLEESPDTAKILQLEFGLNLTTKTNPDEVLKRLICYKYKPFDNMEGRTIVGRKCAKREYEIKIYNKGKQSQIADNILRFEKKIIDARHLKKMGVCFISDLTPEKAEKLLEDLLDVLDEVLFDDKSIDEGKLTTRQNLALAKYRNCNYWSELSRAGRLQGKGIFSKLIEQFGSENYLNTLKNLTQKMIAKTFASIYVFDKTKNERVFTFSKFNYGSKSEKQNKLIFNK